MNPFEMAELCKPDVMGLHRVRQDAGFDSVPDLGVVLGRTDAVPRLILDHFEVNDFEQDGNPGVESDVNEHTEWVNRHDLPLHSATWWQFLLEFIPFLLAQWVVGNQASVLLMGRRLGACPLP
jgi:hypothetical protein